MKFKNPFKTKKPPTPNHVISINSVPEYPDVIEERWGTSRMTSFFNDFFQATEPDAHNKSSLDRYIASEKDEILCRLDQINADSRHRSETLLIEMQCEVADLTRKLRIEEWLQSLILEEVNLPPVFQEGGEPNDH